MKRSYLRLAEGLVILALSAACTRVATVPLDAESQNFFNTVRLIMSSAEVDIFRHLPDVVSRREFIEDFWAKRDPDPETPENEFYDEFQRRVEYCNRRFIEGRKGIDTDRGRIYLQLGHPEKEDSYTEMGGTTTLYWSYYTYALTITFVERRGGSGFEIKQIMGNLFRAIEKAQLNGFASGRDEAPGLGSFSASYDGQRKEITVSLPVKKIHFREESGVLKVDLDFLIYIYTRSGAQKDRFEDRRNFEGPAVDVEKSKVLKFVFPYDLPPGHNYADILINGGADNGRTRKIFTFKRS
ncbi:MAG: GWxTD domain-containing protein [Candidatus Aminicenantales bacterium]